METQNCMEEERRPLQREAGTQGEASILGETDPQQYLNLADTSYPRSVEGILRMISVVC